MPSGSSPTLSTILAPQTIAVIGASRRPETIGHRVFGNLIAHGFTGSVVPVNPHARAICSVRAVPYVTDAGERPDIAVIVVPKEQVLDVAEQCGAAGVTGLVVISAGFREVGPEGAVRERQLMAIVRRHGMRMVGPNCMGVMNCDPAVSMNATFCSAMPPFGRSAFVSQSGALGLSVLDHAREYGIGIAQFVSVGNKPDVSGNDLLEYWEHDPAVGVILMYVESFGNPARFLEIAGRVTRTKPIVVVKAGRSASGARAASSHTGALAASDAAVDALLAQAGVLRAGSIEELFDMAMAFETRALPRSRRTAVLTNAGGPGILAADAMEACGLLLPDLSPATVDALRPLFPAEASIRNPLDMIASATPAGYRQAMTILLGDPGIDTVVPVFVPPFDVRQEEVAGAIVGGMQDANVPDKTVIGVLMGREGLPAGRAELQQARIPTYIFPESAARALGALNRHVEWTARASRAVRRPAGIDQGGAQQLLNSIAASGREWLDAAESLTLLHRYGIDTARGGIAADADDAVRIAREIGYPVVLKAIAPALVHKTDVGGVRLGVSTDADVRSTCAALLALVDTPDAVRIQVQETVRGGPELIAGISRDASFGPLLAFGLGGVFVEAVRDVVFRIAPIDEAEARDMLSSIRGARVLDAFRGALPVDRVRLADVLVRLGQLAADHPAIAEIDVNPLIPCPRGIVAVDARVRLNARQ